jgi:uncharacterized membrane protein YdjX (TVP38/TMEM64 family)
VVAVAEDAILKRMRLTERVRKGIWLALLVAVLVGASLLLQDVFDTLVHGLAAYERQRPLSGAAVFILLAACSVMLGPFTSAPLIPLVVGVWGTEKTLALLLLGWAVGNAAAYGIGYHFGLPIVRRIVPAEALAKWTRFLGEKVSVWTLFLFRLAAPAEIGYVFGILRYDFPKYLAIVVPAEIPFALVVVYGGEAFIDGRWMTLLIYSVAAIALMAGAGYLYVASRKNR